MRAKGSAGGEVGVALVGVGGGVTVGDGLGRDVGGAVAVGSSRVVRGAVGEGLSRVAGGAVGVGSTGVTRGAAVGDGAGSDVGDADGEGVGDLAQPTVVSKIVSVSIISHRILISRHSPVPLCFNRDSVCIWYIFYMITGANVHPWSESWISR